jgi:hypothetical protein
LRRADSGSSQITQGFEASREHRNSTLPAPAQSSPACHLNPLLSASCSLRCWCRLASGSEAVRRPSLGSSLSSPWRPRGRYPWVVVRTWSGGAKPCRPPTATTRGIPTGHGSNRGLPVKSRAFPRGGAYERRAAPGRVPVRFAAARRCAGAAVRRHLRPWACLSCNNWDGRGRFHALVQRFKAFPGGSHGRRVVLGHRFGSRSPGHPLPVCARNADLRSGRPSWG